MSDEENDDIPMAECGACGAIVPLDSESCPSCDVRFDGVSDEELGECGACGEIIPVDSESCAKCGASFVAIVTPEDESIDDSESDIEISTSEALEVLDSMIEDISSLTEDDEDSEGDNDHSEDEIEEETEDDNSEEESDEEDDSEEVAEDECPTFVRYSGGDPKFIQTNEAYDRWHSWEPQSPAEQMLKNVLNSN